MALDADADSGQSGVGDDPGNFVVTEETERQIEALLALAGLPEIPDSSVRVLERATAETADGPVGAAAALAINLDFGVSLASLAEGCTAMGNSASLNSGRSAWLSE